jgi:dipeptide/tripeptide permease
MKSVVMAIWLLSIALGNFFVAQLNQNFEWLRTMGVSLKGAAYFQFFIFLMLGTAIVFIFFARLYKGKMYIQGDLG